MYVKNGVKQYVNKQTTTTKHLHEKVLVYLLFAL